MPTFAHPKCSVLLESYHAELSEGNAKLERLEEKLAELDTQRIENVQAIEKAVRKITLHKNSTRTEVFRLKGMHLNIVFEPSQLNRGCAF